MTRPSVSPFSMASLACVPRRARGRDAARLAAIQVDSWEATYRGKLPDAVIDARTYVARTLAWQRILREPERSGERRDLFATLIGALDGREAGFLDSGPPRRVADQAPGRLEVTSCYVAPWAWRRGVGRSLWARFVTHASGLEMGECILWVLRDNPRAIAFYEAMGLRCDGTARDEEMAGERVPHLRMSGPLGT